ncbi:TraX family protein [Bifidobacterium moukalabense]|nr:TraX family protein [Bifidobacterium moukalabense]
MTGMRMRPPLDATMLKLIALVCMTLDHVGVFLLPDFMVLRMAGRLAFPIFAFFIAEGCDHTRHMARYLLAVLSVGMVCSSASYLAEGSLYQSIMITFACSIGLILSLDRARAALPVRVPADGLWCAMFLMLLSACFLLFRMRIVPGLETDYGFWGVLTPVLAWLGGDMKRRLSGLAFGLALVCIAPGGLPLGVQACSFLALPLLSLYNGRRGEHSYRMFFYAYYPLHIAVLHGIGTLL